MSVHWNSSPRIEDVVISLKPQQIIELKQGYIPEFIDKDFLRNILDASPGFLILKTGITDSDEHTQRLVYRTLCSQLGTLNNRYGELYDVKDYGGNYKDSNIPVSQTHDTTGFHTDSSAIDYFPFYVGLLCIRPAISGGDSLLVNASNFLSTVKIEQKNLLKVSVIRDIITPGKEYSLENLLKNKFPILNEDGPFPIFRYMRYWIERGHQKADISLSKEYIELLNQFDSYLEDPNKQFCYSLESGDILLFNNTFLLHNRTAFINSEIEGQERLLVRTWIDK
jgi:hypothetical protein